MVIGDQRTGVKVVWRGGTVIRAYDRRARLITAVDLSREEAADESVAAARMESLAKTIVRRRRSAVRRLRRQ